MFSFVFMVYFLFCIFAKYSIQLMTLPTALPDRQIPKIMAISQILL
jgi:hypothetical protein